MGHDFLRHSVYDILIYAWMKMFSQLCQNIILEVYKNENSLSFKENIYFSFHILLRAVNNGLPFSYPWRLTNCIEH